MKKIAISIVLLVVLLGTSIAYAMEVTTYTGTTTGNNVANIYSFTTYRAGNIVVHAKFPLNNHGIYQLNLINTDLQYYACRETLDARWGRVLSGDIYCYTSSQPSGNYTIEFLSNRKVSFIIEVTAETDK